MKIGIDIGGTFIKFGSFENGNLIDKWKVPTPHGSQILTKISEELKKYSDIESIGIAVPGPVKNGYVGKVANIEGFSNHNPGEELKKLLNDDKPSVKVINDGDAAALGEYHFGAGKKFNSIVMMTLGTGIGCGIVLDGKLVSSPHGIAGEIGHMMLPNLRGKSGPTEFEKVASAGAIADSFGTHGDAAKCFEKAREGDTDALGIIDEACEYIGLAMANISMTIDPEAFIIGGGISSQGELLLDGIKKYYDKYLLITKERAHIDLASLGNEAGIVGAAFA